MQYDVGSKVVCDIMHAIIEFRFSPVRIDMSCSFGEAYVANDLRTSIQVVHPKVP